MKFTQADIDRMIQEEVFKDKKVKTEDKQPDLTTRFKKILGEALLKECGVNCAEPYNPEQNMPPKLRKAQKLIRFIDTMIMRLTDIYYQGEKDQENDNEDLNKMMMSSFEPIIMKAIERLEDVWEEEDEKEDISANPNGGTIMIVKGESVKSPQNIDYIVEEVNGETIILKEKGTNKIVQIEKKALSKWS